MWFPPKPMSQVHSPAVQRSLGWGGCLGCEKTFWHLLYPRLGSCSGAPISGDLSPD
jgi:hypothetical protein